MTRLLRRAGGLALLAALLGTSLRAADGADAKGIKAVRDKARTYLSRHQGEDGSFSPRLAGPGVTALVVTALLRNGVSADDPVVSKALAYLEKSVKKDGGIYDRGLANYTTSVAIMGFAEANKGGKYDTLIKNASKFLKRLQYGDNVKGATPASAAPATMAKRGRTPPTPTTR